MPRFRNEWGEETDFAIGLRDVALWVLLTVAMIVEVLWMSGDDPRADWPWEAALAIAVCTHPFAFVLFSKSTDSGRRPSECTALAAVLLLALAAMAHGARHSEHWFYVVVLSVFTAFVLWGTSRAGRALTMTEEVDIRVRRARRGRNI
ncbi:hypothetical protein [Streptomyces sp. GESEQ-35]|uniref:hypothetical protein n=1 Tax=Streptomyces sp. GESEQ-35 TaxID=2812657 RepID=UPI001B31A67B|nr:hypothetical protein [Streptomyces sp. GESEQ-35]